MPPFGPRRPGTAHRLLWCALLEALHRERYATRGQDLSLIVAGLVESSCGGEEADE